MAENKEYIIQKMDEGSILVSEDVICTIAAAAVLDVDGVDSLNANFGAEIADMLGMKNIARGIKISVSSGTMDIACGVNVSYGYDVVEVASNVQNSVANAVSSMTGFSVNRVDVSVNGVGFGKKK